MQHTIFQREHIDCLYCGQSEHNSWAIENGFTAVKCSNCGLIYVNPRPSLSLISESVKTGIHKEVKHGRTAIGKRVKSKVRIYKRIITDMFKDVWASHNTVSWIDVGSGYGEVIEAISELSPAGSKIVGLEPMEPKANAARDRGLNVRQCYLNDVQGKFEFLSLINVYSHIPDFRVFLQDAKKVLTTNGEIFIETGNTADLKSRHEVPGELDLPDHLVFAGEKHLIGYLKEAGFSILSIKKRRVDGLAKCLKNIVKKLLGRKDVILSIPYTSPYRSLLIRAKLT